MSSVPDVWDQLIATFEKSIEQLHAQANSLEDESARQKLLDTASRFETARGDLEAVQQRKAELEAEEKAAAQLAEDRKKAEEERKAAKELKVAKLKEAAAVPKKAKGPQFDAKLGAHLKKTLLKRLGMTTAAAATFDLDDHRRDLEEWAKRPRTGMGESISLESSDEHLPQFPLPGYVKDLLPVSQRHEAFREIICSLARRMPRREAVWWSILAGGDMIGVRDLQRVFDRVPVAKPAFEWVCDPTEERRQKLESLDSLPSLDYPAGCVARAVIWTNKPARDDFDLDNPSTTAEAVARAVLVMADFPGNTRLDPVSFLTKAITHGENVLRGESLWNETLPRDTDSQWEESWDDWFNEDRRR